MTGAPGGGFYLGGWMIDLIRNDPFLVSSQVQDPEHVARSDGGEQKLLRIPSGGVPAKLRVGTAEQVGFTAAGQAKLSFIGSVRTGSGTGIAEPGQRRLVWVYFLHFTA